MLYNQEFFSLATPEQLTNYANILINVGLGKGNGIKPGDVVLVRFEPEGSPLVPYIQTAVTKAGGHLIRESKIPYEPTHSPLHALAEIGTDEQIDFFAIAQFEVLYKQADHYLHLKTIPHAIPNTGITNARERRRLQIEKRLDDLGRDFKEHHWRSYTLCYVPTIALATQAGVSMETLWQEIVTTCYLDSDTAVDDMRHAMEKTAEIENSLNSLHITNLHLQGPAVDLNLTLTPDARFRSSRGGNIPSFECFTTPHAYKTNGWVEFSYPFLYDGNSIYGIRLEFTDGEITTFSAEHGAEVLAGLLELPGMKRLGEFALTDKRVSLIRAVIPGAPLFLENIGGTIHLALGRGYKKCFESMDNTPFCNESVEHRDLVLGGDITVAATTAAGDTEVIFADGICPLVEIAE